MRTFARKGLGSRRKADAAPGNAYPARSLTGAPVRGYDAGGHPMQADRALQVVPLRLHCAQMLEVVPDYLHRLFRFLPQGCNF